MGTALFKKIPLNSDFDGKKVLNIGCGTEKLTSKNAVNMDKYPICNPDVVHDASTVPYPFPDATFDLVIANHVMEHVNGWWDAFSELARVLKDGGYLIIYVPGNGSDSQMGYRDHINTINEFSFFGTYDCGTGTNAWAMSQAKSHASQMSMVSLDITYYNYWWIRFAPKSLRRWMGRHLRNVISEQGYWFEKIPVGGKS